MKAIFERLMLTKTLRASLLLLLAVSPYAYAQESGVEEFKPKIRGAIMMANSHVPNATEGGKDVAIIPTWGFDSTITFIAIGPLRCRVISNCKVLRSKRMMSHWNGHILLQSRQLFTITPCDTGLFMPVRGLNLKVTKTSTL